MFAKVRENPLLVKTYSRRDQLAAKYRWRRSQMPRSMSLRGVPARLASAAQYSSANYTDSDSDDGGVLLVREDIDFTQDQGSPLPLDNVSDEVSPEGDVSSANDTERDDIISLEENQSSPPSSVVEGEGSVQSVENINIHELALDTTKNSQTLAVDGAKNQAKVKSKSSPCAKKDDKSNLVEGLSRNSTNTQNGHIQSEQKNGKFERTSKSGRIRKSKNHSSSQNVKKDSDDDEKMVTKNKQSANKTPSRTPAKRSSRKRRTASSLKYGDLYYSADYVLDSEEEVEQKNKDVAVLSAVEGSKRTKSKTNAKVTLEDVSVEDFSGTMTKNNCSELKQQKNSYIAKLVNEDGEVISISDDELGKEVKEKQKKSLLKDKKKLKSQNVKSGNKSGKGRLKKLQKSHAKFELLDDETEEINLRKAISIMNKKHKKPERVKLDENKSRITGPFLRVKTTEPCCCRVVNQYEEGSEMSDQKITKKVSTPITVSTVHMSKLSTEKSIHVPSNSLTETNWVCQLCHKHSSFKFLGDLFGPYFCEGNIPSSSPQDTPNSDLKKHKQKIVTNLDVGDLQQKTKKRTNLADLSRSEEVWVHEDCIAWADGVLLIGQKIYGLEEATAIASTTMCSACKENGAMVGCLHKGCSQKFHYICAVESGVYKISKIFR
uniref:Retinoic acid-induced protein 1 n=1 Tax=Magallana gigas TaxID=29159 RepID=K1Q9V1_MAGGI